VPALASSGGKAPMAYAPRHGPAKAAPYIRDRNQNRSLVPQDIEVKSQVQETTMRILVNDYAGHPFQLQLSRELARKGHDVLHTYFGPYQTPKGRTDVDATAGNLTFTAITIDGEFKQHAALSRRAADKAYGKAACQHVKAFRPDVVISANTPLDAQKQLLETTHAVGGVFVFWLQDVLSAAIEFVLRKKGFPLATLAGQIYSRLERRLLQKSDAIVCIAPEFRPRLENWGIASEKTFVIENWAPLDEITPLHRDTTWAIDHNLFGKTRFVYSGTLGMKHRPELLLELARKFEGRRDVSVVVVAQGAGADWLRTKTASIRPGALQIFPFQPYERLSEILASADVLVTLLDDDCGAFSVPSKTLAYMCAGRSLLVAAPADNLIRKIIVRSGAGEATAATAESFLAGAERLLLDPQRRETCGRSAREYATQMFCIEKIHQRFMETFAVALQGRGNGLTERVSSEVAAN
jgi:colanic acid biosynthesis glycosyl transferase WcaI